MKHATLALLALVLLLVGVGPARADLLYDNGPMRARYGGGGPEIANISRVSDSFTLSHASYLTAAQVSLAVYTGSKPTTLYWSIGTAPFASDLNSGAATLTNSFYGHINNLFDAYQSTLSLNAPLGAGRYWLTLQSATSTNSIAPNWTVYWIENGGPSLARRGDFHRVYDDLPPSESFRIYGTATVPEPAGITLLGIGITCLASYGWRRRKQSAPHVRDCPTRMLSEPRPSGSGFFGILPSAP